MITNCFHFVCYFHWGPGKIISSPGIFSLFKISPVSVHRKYTLGKFLSFVFSPMFFLPKKTLGFSYYLRFPQLLFIWSLFHQENATGNILSFVFSSRFFFTGIFSVFKISPDSSHVVVIFLGKSNYLCFSRVYLSDNCRCIAPVSFVCRFDPWTSHHLCFPRT